MLVDAEREDLAGRDEIEEALRSHVRELVRSCQRDSVLRGLDHVQAASDLGASVVDLILFEVDGAAQSAEWNHWEDRDAETVDWMRSYVSPLCARGARRARLAARLARNG